MPLPQPMNLAQSSSSHKRTHSEISRSESRSPGPPPPKRRRTDRTSSTSHSLHRSSSRNPPIHHRRFAGDGLDFRSPAMSSATQDLETIDLTVDDDSLAPSARQTSQSPEFYMPHSSLQSDDENTAQIQSRRAPPFPAANHVHQPEVINLLDDEEDEAMPGAANRDRFIHPRLPSPDVEFVQERPAQAALSRNVRRRLPPPDWHPAPLPTGAPYGAFHFLRQTAQNMQHAFGHFQLPAVFQPTEIPRVQGGPADGGLEVLETDPFPEIAFNYQQAAFQVGRGSETPQRVTMDIKPPPAARDGYIRTYAEESILICPNCADELGTGGKDENDALRQVWVNKACGHVYCGACVAGRTLQLHKNKRDSRKSTKFNSDSMKKCQVDGCSKSMTGKAGLVQIYL